MIRPLSKIFFTGLAAVLPIIVTVWLVWWMGTTFEKFIGGLFRFALPDSLYFPGLGSILGIALIFFVGLLAKAWLFRMIFEWWDDVFHRIPLVKTIYGAMRDFMDVFSGSAKDHFNRVVLVEFDAPKAKLMGFVTREVFDGLAALEDTDEVAVYFPFSYQIGGYMVFLEKSRLIPVEMPTQEAMRFVLTAGLSGLGDGKK